MEHRWGITFLKGCSGLTEREKNYLIGEATILFLKEEEIKKIKTETLEGYISTGRPGVLGCFSGMQYDAIIETNKGKYDLSFLVSDLTRNGAFTYKTQTIN